MRCRRLLPLLVAATVAWSCSGAEGDARPTSSARGAVERAKLPPYQVRPVRAAGSITGMVIIDGDAPRDSVVRPDTNADVCGTSFVDETVVRSGDRLSGVVVWVEGVRQGKALPRERRYEAVVERCRIRPRVQVAMTGGTLNLLNRDRAEHAIAIVRRDTGDTLEVFHAHAEGMVVPLDRPLAEPGHLELRCGIHPWMRADVLVFDHPYVATTGGDGSFAIDSVPAGRHAVVAWHERFGRMEGTVDVAAGVAARLELKARAR